MIPVGKTDSAGNMDDVESRENTGKSEYTEKVRSAEKSEYTEKVKGAEKSERSEYTEKSKSAEKSESVEKSESAKRPEGTERSESTEKSEYTETAEDIQNTEDTSGTELTGCSAGGNNEEKAADTTDQEKTERRRDGERKRNMRNKRNTENTKRKRKLTGSFAAKVAAFFLLVLSTASAVVSGFGVTYLVLNNYYDSNIREVFLYECSGEWLHDVYLVRDYIASGELGHAREVCEGKNIDIALLQGDLRKDNGSATDNPVLIWTTYSDTYDIGLTEDIYLQFSAESLTGNNVINYYRLHSGTDYVFRVYFNTDFPERDRYAEIFNECLILYNLRFTALWILGISIFIGLNSFLFLMCSAGHRNGMEGIQPSVFSGIPLDLYSTFYGIVAFSLLLIIANTFDYNFGMIEAAAISVAISAEVLWCTFYLRELAVRMKLGSWWKNTIVYYVLRLLGRIIRLFWRGICAVLREIPSIPGTLLCFVGLSILEFLVAVLFGAEAEGIVVWMMEKIILFPVIVYFAMMCKRLLNGSRALAEGRQEEIVDTSHMFGDFKECGENLNNIGQGISRAVAERMKSEHLKTELITNVSHDIKTPLTSIINYANLIAEETTENEKIREYSEVLVRQSGRMKKLLEDLLEASKATTGNLEVNFQPCEVSVILSQAIGEYQQRMEEKQLELIVIQPEQEINIMADGRHLWRVFDNLLNNICKYAREDSRVYLNVEAAERKVSIIFRNMSKYALNITPDELQERFVRGDKSRHMDGNGLGLSIAKSLMDLMNGQMEIVTDGDLFKVTLRFDELTK